MADARALVRKGDIHARRVEENEMGRRTTQIILVCSECGRTPEDGKYLWEMCGEYVCAACVDKDEDEVVSSEMEHTTLNNF